MAGTAAGTADEGSRRRLTPGDAILHPVALAAVALLVVNDHVLKSLAPGAVTGKLSDVTGMVFFPLLLVAAAEVLVFLVQRTWDGPTPRAVVIAVAATGLAFAAAKATPPGEAVYETVLGLAQWPFGAIVAAVNGRPIAPPHPVELARDPTDLVALAALWVPYVVGRRRVAREAALSSR